MQVGNILILADQLGNSGDGEIPRSIKEKMENCYKNIEGVHKEFGASLENIIDETWFFTNVNECMENVNEIFFTRERILGCKPEFSQSLVWTTDLVSPEYELEIKCIAAL